jgi:hypothetical protein
MDYPSPIEVSTPSSELSDLRFPGPRTHHYVGTQFQSGGEINLSTDDGLVKLAGTAGSNMGDSSLLPTITITDEDNAGELDWYEDSDEDDVGEIGLASFPWDISKAHLDWNSDQDWLLPTPVNIWHAFTFPVISLCSHSDDPVSSFPHLFAL